MYILYMHCCRANCELERLAEHIYACIRTYNEYVHLLDAGSLVSAPLLSSLQERVHPQFEHVVWTREMKRMAVLVGRAVQFREPVLLIGETGCARGTASVQVAPAQP